MGCILGRSLNEIENDPSVAMYADVIEAGVRDYRGFGTFSIRSHLGPGLLYVRGDVLYLENTCFKRSWYLSNVETVELVTGDITIWRRMGGLGSKVQIFCFNSRYPGLKIVFMHNTDGDNDAIISMDDAAKFNLV